MNIRICAMSYNCIYSKIIFIQRSFVFYQKKASSVKWTDPREMFKKAFKSVCISTVVVSSDSLSPPSSSSSMKTPQTTEEDSDDP
jgi:hypothetical protein